VRIDPAAVRIDPHRVDLEPPEDGIEGSRGRPISFAMANTRNDKTKARKRSNDENLRPTRAVRATAAIVPTSKALAALLGVAMSKPLDPKQVARLRRPLPGYTTVLDDAAARLDAETVLSVKGVTPDGLLGAKASREDLAAREGVAYAVYRSIYEQRMEVDDQAIEMLQKLVRRIEALTEDDPELPVRWKPILDFMAQFRPGPKTKPAPVPAPPVGNGANVA
jgi:hypothetical protein